jgi:spermidine synthase
MPRTTAYAVVFLTSAAVLVIEILAGRLLAPYVGVTLETFTGIIGTVLAGIALGSWIGGRLADLQDPRLLLGPTIALGGVLTLLAVPIIDFLGAGLRGGDQATIVLLAFSGFFAPATVLSAVSPTVVKLRLHDLEQTGATVGRLSAVGTAGAIFGTFTTGFLLVAAMPTRPTLRLLGALLVLGGLSLGIWLSRTRPSALLMLGALLAGLLSLSAKGPCEFESAYFCGQVLVDPDRPSGRVLLLDTLRHSYVDLNDPTHLEFTYSQAMSDVLAVVAPEDRSVDALHIGGGGFTLPRYLEATRPGATNLVLELDPMLVEVAENELGLVRSEDLQVRTGDARLTLQDVEQNSVDVVIGDAFGGVSVPWHLTTREFVELIHARLRPGGTYALNMIDYGPLGFARAHVATLAAVFEHVAVLAPAGRLQGATGGNFILVASDRPIDLEAMLERNALRGDDEAGLSDLWQSPGLGVSLAAFLGDAEVLTDDHAPVDQLITPLPTA